MRPNSKRVGVVALLLTATMAFSACGDDDDDDDGAGAEGTSAPALTGEPIEIGLVNTENSPAGNYVDGRKGVEAAVEYINRELGGVNGRPLAVESCITNASPESSSDCAIRFVQQGKVAVMPYIDIGAAAAMPIYAKSGMPYVGGDPISAEEYVMPTSFSFIGGVPGGVVGLAAFAAKDLRAKKVVIVGADIPQVGAAVDGFIKPVLTALGSTDVVLLQESATAADFSPVMTRVKQQEADAVINVFAGPTCARAMQASGQVGIDPTKVLYGQECASQEVVETGAGGGDGAYFQSPYLSPSSDDPNVALYREKMQAYAADAPIGQPTQSGFNSVMNLYGVLVDLDPSAISRESLVAALKSIKDKPGFMSHSYTCDGNQFPGLTGLCDTHVRMLKYDNGSFVETSNEWIDGAAVIAGR